VSGITDPSEEYFKDGLWAWVTDQWKKLTGDAAGHLQVDVVASGLPTGAATSASQTTMITALQLIDDLRGALNSIHTDELDVVIDGQSADVEVTQQTAADLTPGVMGWDGSAWRKLAVLWGYSDRYAEQESQDNVDAGNVTLTFSTVPAGEVWVVSLMSAMAAQDNPAGVNFFANCDGTTHRLEYLAYPTAYLVVSLQTTIVLKEDDYLEVRFDSCSANDDVEAYAMGYKMKIAE